MSNAPDQPQVIIPEEGQDRYRQYHGTMAVVVKAVGVATALFALLYVSGVLPYFEIYFQHIQFNAIFMSGILILTFLLFPAWKGENQNRLPWYDILIILAMLAGTAHIIINAEEIITMGSLLATPQETVLGIVSVVVLLEAVRRTVGWPVVIITLIFILYAKFSYLLPGTLTARTHTWPRIMAEAYLSRNGIFGELTSLASGIIIAFVAFGSFFIKVGGGEIFLDLALSLTGGIRGGPAKAAILGSALFGTISGSPAANVAVTGTITIPLMKRTGYDPVFAGAVETVASTGGMLMPPIMGAVAFVMADMLKVSYFTIAQAAAIPAVLYFLALYAQVDLRAARDGLRGIPRRELPSFVASLKGGWEFVIPLSFLVFLLMGLRYPPEIAASYAIGGLVIATLFRKRTRLTLGRFIDALAESANAMLMVAPVVAVAGIMVAMLTMTGLGPKLAEGLVAIAGGSQLALFILAGLACYIAGMGISIIATYILLALLVVPALTSVGVPEMVSHFFIFYMGLSMFITPPYAPAAFVAAAISGASPYRTGFLAMRLGIVTFIVPFVLAYNPALILIGTPVEIVLATVTAIIGVLALAVGIEGYLFTRANWLQRVLAVGSGLTLIVPGLLTDSIGFGLLVVVVLWQWVSKKRPAPATLSAK